MAPVGSGTWSILISPRLFKLSIGSTLKKDWNASPMRPAPKSKRQTGWKTPSPHSGMATPPVSSRLVKNWPTDPSWLPRQSLIFAIMPSACSTIVFAKTATCWGVAPWKALVSKLSLSASNARALNGMPKVRC